MNAPKQSEKTEQSVRAVMKRNSFRTTTLRKGKARAFENFLTSRRRF